MENLANNDLRVMNEKIVRRFWHETWNEGNLDIIDEMVKHEFILYAAGEVVRSKNAFHNWLKEYRNGISDIHLEVIELFSTNYRVITRWRLRGKHTGRFLGFEATGKDLDFTGINYFIMDQGKIVSGYTERDAFSILKQMGII